MSSDVTLRKNLRKVIRGYIPAVFSYRGRDVINQLETAYLDKLVTALRSAEHNTSRPSALMRLLEKNNAAVFSLMLDVNEMVARIDKFVPLYRKHSIHSINRIVDAVVQDEKPSFTGHSPTPDQSKRYRAIYLAYIIDQQSRYVESTPALVAAILEDFDRMEAAAPVLYALAEREPRSNARTHAEVVDIVDRYPDRLEDIIRIVQTRSGFSAPLVADILDSATPALVDGIL